VYSLAKLATDEHARAAQAQTPSHPYRTITTSIAVEEPSQPSCCDMFTTLRSLSSDPRWPPRTSCTCLAVKRGRRACVRGAKHGEELALWRRAGRNVHERGAKSY